MIRTSGMMTRPLLTTISLVLALGAFLPPVLRAEDGPPFTVSEPRPLTAGPDHDDYWPCFSHDGSRLLFSRRSAGKPWQLFQVPVAGGEATPLYAPPPSPAATRVARSPDGRLAFVGDGGIWITDAEGGHPEKLRIKGLAGNPSYPSWYPDGKHLLLVAYRGKAGGTLHRVEIGSGETAALTDPSKVRAGMACVSRDGSRIVFAGQRNKGGDYDQNRNSIWLLDQGHEPRVLVEHQGRAPTWSPDGRWIAYESDHGSPDHRQAIFITSPEGNIDQRVTSFELNANHPVWSPDGRSLAFSILSPGLPGHTCIAIAGLPSLENAEIR